MKSPNRAIEPRHLHVKERL